MSTPKQKALELIDFYSSMFPNCESLQLKMAAKKTAEEVLFATVKPEMEDIKVIGFVYNQYWLDVVKEIDNM